jgi:hypothetical protein
MSAARQTKLVPRTLRLADLRTLEVTSGRPVRANERELHRSDPPGTLHNIGVLIANGLTQSCGIVRSAKPNQDFLCDDFSVSKTFSARPLSEGRHRGRR